MKQIKCVNSFGNEIIFKDAFPYFLEKYEGIHKKTAELYGVASAFSIGEYYTGGSVPKRNIVIYGYFKDNFFERRQFLYNVFPYKDEGTLYFTENEHTFKINYRVEDVDIDDDKYPRYFTISLICFFPYFSEAIENKVSLANIVGGFEFPFEIINDEIEFETIDRNMIVDIENPTKIEAGLKIIFSALGKVKSPTLKNITNGELLTLDIEMQRDDVIIVTTYMNDKNIILKRNNQEQNINNNLLFGTKFLQLRPGTNRFKIQAEDGINNLSVDIFYSIYYEAI